MSRRTKRFLCGITVLSFVLAPVEAQAESPSSNAPVVAEILNEPPTGAPENAVAYRGTGGYIMNVERNVTPTFLVNGGYYGAAPKTIGFVADGYNIQFDGAGDSDLVVGAYNGAVRYPFNSASEPGLDVSGNGRGCNTVSGEFFIDDIASSGTTLTRFAARWVHRCEGGTLYPAYGWITYNTAIRGADVQTTQVPVGVTRSVVFRNTGNGPVTLNAATLEGEAFSFAPGQNSCNGATLAAGSTCTVGIRFGQASTPPTSHVAGKVSITSSNNGAASVTLDGLAAPAGDVMPITPFRLIDTRLGLGTPNALGQQDTRTVKVAGVGGVPSNGAIGVMANIVGITPTENTWLTTWAAGRAKPQTSNVNPVAGKVTSNFAFIPLSSTGDLSVFNALGRTDVVIDVLGWVAGDVQPSGSRVRTIAPTRVYDSRSGDGPIAGSRRVSVLASGVPSTATAIIMNVAVTAPTQASWLNITAAEEARPFTAIMNFDAGETLSSLAISRISRFGEVDVYNQFGTAHVVIDVVGYLAPKTGTDLGRVLFVNPTRVVDTRDLGSALTGDQEFLELPSRSAAFVNITATETTNSGWLTMYAGVRSNTANLNWKAGETRGNLQLIRTGTTRAFVSSGSSHLIADAQVMISNDTL
jgi:hypothetical protein